MQIIQFTCPIPETASQLKALMTSIVNDISRLSFLANDPDYVTNPFGVEGWFEHLQTPGLYWTSWDAVYSALGDTGRSIADNMILPFMVGQEFAAFPGIVLEVVGVADPVAGGYTPEPE